MKTSIQFRLRGSLLAGVAALLAITAHAQQMNYQGRLTDDSGNPLQDGQHILTFNLYTAATNGTRTWGPFITDGGAGDGHTAKADVVNGRFNVILGPKDTSARSLVSAFGAGTPYLEIQVNLNSPILPRQQVLAAPEAIHALIANTVTNGAIGTAQLADGSVTVAKLSEIGNFLPWSTAPDGANIYRASGNVGIGTTAPAQKLHVEGSVQIAGGDLLFDNARILKVRNAAGIHENFLVPRHSDDRTYLNYGSGGFNIANRDGAPVMWMSSAGNVGVGTTQPEVKLDVRGGNLINLSNPNTHITSFYPGSSIFNYNRHDVPGEQPLPAFIGIRTDLSVAAGIGFYAYSDRRIKKDIKASETSEDLRAIRQLRVSDYRMVDPSQSGNSWRKGFIAQEVEEILPGAVTRSTEFVPDIFSLATATEYDPATKTLTVTLSKDHGVNVGDRVRLQTDDRRQDLAVAATPSGREFVVEQCDRAPEKVFVYGRLMNDFRTVDYDRVFTTGIGAVQELAQRLEAAETELSEVKAKLAAQQTITVRWEARFQAMEQRLAMQPVMDQVTGQKQTAAAAQ